MGQLLTLPDIFLYKLSNYPCKTNKCYILFVKKVEAQRQTKYISPQSRNLGNPRIDPII